MNFEESRHSNQNYLQVQSENQLTIFPRNQIVSDLIHIFPHHEFLLAHHYFEGLFEILPLPPRTPKKRMSTGKHNSLSPEKLKKKSTKLKRCYVLVPKLNKKHS